MKTIELPSRHLAGTIQDLHHAERLVLRTLPRMCRASQSEELADALAEFYEESLTHVHRLEDAAAELGGDAAEGRSAAMERVAREIDEFLESRTRGRNRDLGLTAGARQMAACLRKNYRKASELAREAGAEGAADALGGTDDDLRATERTLARLTGILTRMSARSEDAGGLFTRGWLQRAAAFTG